MYTTVRAVLSIIHRHPNKHRNVQLKSEANSELGRSKSQGAPPHCKPRRECNMGILRTDTELHLKLATASQVRGGPPTSSVVTCTIFNPAHIPESKENRDQRCDTGNLEFSIPPFKEEKVEEKSDTRYNVESEVDVEWYPHQSRSYGRF